MVYHETQKFQYCAIHAVNALLGYAAFTVQDFEQVAKQLGKETGYVGQPYRSLLGLGDYDVNVIGRILQCKGLEIEWQDKRVTPQLERFHEPHIVGLLINVYIRRWWRFWGSSRHWSTIKLIQDKYYWLDSFNQSPIVWTEPCCVEHYLQQLLLQDGELLWIKQIEQDRSLHSCNRWV
ncbi:hypothetical protein GpartN1_g6929.t1 [Galdieria partita]|uniref:ubiquitinyl hydrolase 1 n=1 Tax=Galdieria partita TaxID=83374 RepID=A0A9C7USR5_9RHOD|nr:hypothetical protein GpartN1_g6097.t1 [Galdieria partita]GJQ15138.1 hypothetical protein GpartN1_g6929.t1 [Galdieria partita]